MKTKKSIARWVALAVTLLLMGLIFYFSSQPGQTSYGLSSKVASTFQHHATTTMATPSLFSSNFHANIRKWAHVYLYTALGISVSATVFLFLRARSSRVSHRPVKGALFSAAICTLYAASDELHQFFVPGRAALVTDIGVDALGFLSGIVVVFLFSLIFEYRQQKKKRASPDQ